MKLRHCLVTLVGIVLVTGLVTGCTCLFPVPTDGTTDGNGDGTTDGNGTAPDGSALYSTNCSNCHGADGSGPPDVRGMTSAQLTTGLESATHGSITLTAEEIAAIATFLGG